MLALRHYLRCQGAPEQHEEEIKKRKSGLYHNELIKKFVLKYYTHITDYRYICRSSSVHDKMCVHGQNFIS